MRFFKRISLIAVISLVAFSGNGFAQMVSGKVANADASTRKLTLSTVNPASGEIVNSDLWVDADAALEGFSALGEIKKGDMVWAEAETDSEGNLRATKITRG